MRLRSPIVGSIFAVVFAMNPGFVTGCGIVDKYEFDERQALALLESAEKQGPYRFTEDGSTYEVSFTVEQKRGADSQSSLDGPSLARPAHACGNRTFLRSANACLDTTEVPVDGKVTIKRLEPIAATILDGAPTTRGVFRIEGKKLEDASVDLEVGRHRVEIRTTDAKTFTVTHLSVDAPPTRTN